MFHHFPLHVYLDLGTATSRYQALFTIDLRPEDLHFMYKRTQAVARPLGRPMKALVQLHVTRF